MAEQNLVKKKGSKSAVWNYFGLRANGNGVVLQEMEDEPVWRTCKKSVRAKSGNTYNLLAHLRDHHADLYAEASKGVQSKGIFVELLFHHNVHLVLVDTL